jgi:hypothetical protein
VTLLIGCAGGCCFFFQKDIRLDLEPERRSDGMAGDWTGEGVTGYLG